MLDRIQHSPTNKIFSGVSENGLHLKNITWYIYILYIYIYILILIYHDGMGVSLKIFSDTPVREKICVALSVAGASLTVPPGDPIQIPTALKDTRKTMAKVMNYSIIIWFMMLMICYYIMLFCCRLYSIQESMKFLRDSNQNSKPLPRGFAGLSPSPSLEHRRPKNFLGGDGKKWSLDIFQSANEINEIYPSKKKLPGVSCQHD